MVTISSGGDGVVEQEMVMVRRMALAVGLVCVLVGLGGCDLTGSDTSDSGAPPPPKPAGVVNYRLLQPEYLTRQHRYGHISYPTSPPVGGDHNPVWMECNGDIYVQPVANEHAVHSLEHGAVWVTYRPNLPLDQVHLLDDLVQDRPFMFMSPYPGLDQPISLQAWGYQLKVDSADDPAIVQFIRAYRVNASLEPAADCSNGITQTGVDAMLDPPPTT
jgi:hypothetical protein